LEEFATFMSFNGDLSGMRVLSVESVERPTEQIKTQQKADVITMPIVRSKSKRNNEQQLYKSLSFK